MEESSRKSVFLPPMTLAEMMPHLGGILPERERLKLTAQKSKKLRAEPHTTSKDFKPFVTMTMAQLRAELNALKPKDSPKRGRPPASMVKRWNTSTKCENKRVAHTANASSKKVTARKILNFQPVSKPVLSNIPRPSMRPPLQTPRPVKQDRKTNIAGRHLDDKKPVRISGISNIQETPVVVKQTATRKLAEDNKENIHKTANEDPHSTFDESFRQLLGNKKPAPIPKVNQVKQKSMAPPEHRGVRQTVIKPVPTDLRQGGKPVKTELQPNMLSKKSDVDDIHRHLQCKDQMITTGPSPTPSQANSEQSFLEQEKFIYRETASNMQTVMEDSPIVSTPFKKYRDVEQYFNDSSDIESSLTAINATNVEGASIFKPNVSKEEGDILSLCDLMDKAKVTYCDKYPKNYKVELLKMKSALEIEKENILTSSKRNELMLNSVNKLLSLMDVVSSPHEKKSPQADKVSIEIIKSPEEDKSTLNRQNEVVSIKKSSPAPRRQSCKPFPWRSETNNIYETLPQTVHKTYIRRISKSPTYTIPKRSPCLRKMTLCKSMPMSLDHIPAIATELPRSKSLAMNVYMKMKEQCNFLMTPVANKTLPSSVAPNTPAITSLNLQSQLEMLYEETP